MTDANNQVPKDKFQQEFEALPLEEKVKRLLKFEAVTLTEAFNYGVNESMKAADRLGDVLSEFGKKVETEFKKAAHHGEASCEPPRAEGPKPKTGGPRKSPPRAPKA